MAAMIMVSCSCDDNQSQQATAGDTDGLDMELTYVVGEAQEDSVFTRAIAQPQPEKQIFMGMEVETSVTENQTEALTGAGSQTRATVYNTVSLEGKTVYAFVYDPSTNRTIADRQTLTISGGKLTVKGKCGCKTSSTSVRRLMLQREQISMPSLYHRTIRQIRCSVCRMSSRTLPKTLERCRSSMCSPRSA